MTLPGKCSGWYVLELSVRKHIFLENQKSWPKELWELVTWVWFRIAQNNHNVRARWMAKAAARFITQCFKQTDTWLERYPHPMWCPQSTSRCSLGCAQVGHSLQLSTGVVAGCGCQNARRSIVTLPCQWLTMPCGLHTCSFALCFEEKPARTMPFCLFAGRMRSQTEGGVPKWMMPSLLCLLFYDAFSDHACGFLCASMHLEAELLT